MSTRMAQNTEGKTVEGTDRDYALSRLGHALGVSAEAIVQSIDVEKLGRDRNVLGFAYVQGLTVTKADGPERCDAILSAVGGDFSRSVFVYDTGTKSVTSYEMPATKGSFIERLQNAAFDVLLFDASGTWAGMMNDHHAVARFWNSSPD